VNDGTPESGNETRSAEDIRDYLAMPGGPDMDLLAPLPGRGSLVWRLEGTDPGAPGLCLIGHTDVVPVSPENWSRDPFGGEVVNGELWGRGAVDMLNLTASMAVAVRHLSSEGFRPRGTLVYVAVADEEAGGRYGAEWLVDHHYDLVGADYVVTESGGLSRPGPDGPRLLIATGEKGLSWGKLTVKGTPGHGSMPFGSDNALVKAAEVIRRLAGYRPPARVSDTWRQMVELLDVPAEARAGLVDPGRVDETCASLRDPRTAAFAHACTHLTISPNVVRGGDKTNVIPDAAEIDVDVRTLAGQHEADVANCLAEALGDLWPEVTWSPYRESEATECALATPLSESITRVGRAYRPGASLVPWTTTGGTDARFFRARGSVAYGFGLFSDQLSLDDFNTRFHGNDERVDIASVGLSTNMWVDLVRDFLG
jgi:acetylornithine deacetylase/succinyl-diaminopimelate desuccinylase-like protein